MNDYNVDDRKDWRRRLYVRRNDSGSLVVESSKRRETYVNEIGAVLHRAGYRYKRNDASLPGEPHFCLMKHKSVVFVCDCYDGVGLNRTYGVEHDCHWSGIKTGDTLAAVEEDTRLLDLVVRGVESLGYRVEVVFRCQTDNREDLHERLESFLVGRSTYSGRDKLAWLKRYGAVADFGVEGGVATKFLLPAIMADHDRGRRKQAFIGRFGQLHGDVFRRLPLEQAEGFNNLVLGFVDQSGAFMSRSSAMQFAKRHGLVKPSCLDEAELRATDLYGWSSGVSQVVSGGPD